MRRLVATILLLTACGDAGATTTAPTTGVPGITPPATTAPATTAPPPPTTSVPPTTVIATTTVPVTGPAVAASSSCVLGWWDDGWFSVADDNSIEPPIFAGDALRVADLFGVEEAIVTALYPYDDIGSPAWYVDLQPPQGGGVATSGSWNPAPHLVEASSASLDVYLDQAALIMEQRGYPGVPIELSQVIRTDLEGDGVHEVIVSAQHPGAADYEREVGVFSLVFLRRVVEGEVQTAILHHSIFTAEDVGLATSAEHAQVAAMADLNGDGRMEIVIDARGYEWYWSEAFEYVNDDLGPVSVMVCGGGV